MALKIGGTEVVDNSRQLKNIASVDATTVAALGTAGVGGGGGIELTTSEAVVEGDTLAYNFTSGKVGKVRRTGGSGYTNLGTLQSHMTGRIAHISGDVFAVNYEDSSNNQHSITLARWNSSTNTFTSGTPYSFSGRSGLPSQSAIVLYSSATNKVIWITMYNLSGSNYNLHIMAFTPNTTNLTLAGAGSEAVDSSITSSGPNTLSGTLDSTGTKAFVLYRSTGSHSSGQFGMGRVISIGASGTSTLTVGSITGPDSSSYFGSGDFDNHHCMSDGSKIIASYWNAGNYYAVAGTLSGTSISWGSRVNIGSVYHTYYSNGNLFKHSGGKFGVVVHTGSSTVGMRYFSVSSSNVISGATSSSISIDTSNTPIYISYDSTNNRLYFGSYSGSVTKFGSMTLNTSVPTEISSTVDSVNVLSNGTSVLSTSYNPSAEICFYGLNGSNLFGYYAPQIDNFNFFVGVAKEAASANTTVKIANAGQIATGLSGLTAGYAYRIRYDGTWGNATNIQVSVDAFNQAQKTGHSGVALTSTTMLMINDFMHN